MKKSTIVLIVLIFVMIGIIIYLVTKKEDKDKKYNFDMYFFNAGKADAILLNYKNKYIMIDTAHDTFSNEILDYFKKNNITKLDYLIITHFDKDHVGGAAAIIDTIEIENILESNYPKDSEYYKKYVEALNNKGLIASTITTDYEFNYDDLKFKVNGPNKIYDNNESNNSSLIVSIDYKDNSFLFMGDAENDRLEDFISTNKKEYEFIKMPHHGKYQKNVKKLIENVKPNIAVITSSDEEPEEEKTIKLLEENNIDYYLTREGEITIHSDGESIYVE